MSDATVSAPRPASAPPPKLKRLDGRRSPPGLLLIFLLVFGAQLAFGMWMSSRGFVYPDAISRAFNALQVLYSTDPHLAAIGFVWMPLPSLIELLWVSVYPLWPGIVSSGFASTLTTALAGGLTAVLLLATARRLGISSWYGWLYTLAVVLNPMLFWYGANGMSEGVAAPFLIGAVCCLVLFWHTGRRRFISAGAVALALGFASLYETVPYGAGLFAALVLGVLSGSEREEPMIMPQGRWRAVFGLGTLFLVPSVYVAALWVGANAVIMDDPLFFAQSEYGNKGQTTAWNAGGYAFEVAGDWGATLGYAVERAWPFLIPLAFLLLIRAVDGRLFRVNTLSLVLMSLIVQLGLIVPFIYLGLSFGWLRFFMYPLFVAAGWGLYEVARSKRRKLAGVLVLAGWVLVAPCVLWAMSQPELGQEEYHVAWALQSGENAEQVGFMSPEIMQKPVARYLEEEVFPDGESVAMDAFQGYSIAVQVSPEDFRERLFLTADRRFEYIVEDPTRYGVSYFLVPSPEEVPQDAIVRERPGLWAGETPGFELVESFPYTTNEWRLYKVVPSNAGEPGRNDERPNDRAA